VFNCSGVSEHVQGRVVEDPSACGTVRNSAPEVCAAPSSAQHTTITSIISQSKDLARALHYTRT